ncbi:hypothetical protein [uncultured Thiodictyon sp.]|uniref:hypothetical protein n=1 Tax=uncultured Thiodictyon sp. TaxID=1846217 RepID=UPI0025D843B6|nr:hypothetical protein [uncultured Thiodictyon sp.]
MAQWFTGARFIDLILPAWRRPHALVFPRLSGRDVPPVALILNPAGSGSPLLGARGTDGRALAIGRTLFHALPGGPPGRPVVTLAGSAGGPGWNVG